MRHQRKGRHAGPPAARARGAGRGMPRKPAKAAVKPAAAAVGAPADGRSGRRSSR